MPMRTAFLMLMPLPMPPATEMCCTSSGVKPWEFRRVMMAEKIAPFARMKLSMSTLLMATFRPVEDSSGRR